MSISCQKEISIKEELPILEYVSNAVKERYEYNPVIRNQIVYRKPEDRITMEIMTKFEYCEVISHRAKQFENGGKPFTTLDGLTDPIAIAKKEIHDKKCPLCIVRMITDIIAEKWSVNELAIPYD
jgi:DNA-directed RNA polymerase I, II, and III subunit RPABC2